MDRWRASSRPSWALLALLLAAPLAASAVHIIFDETLWTKKNWAQYKIDPGIWGHLNPSDDAIKQPELRSVVQGSTWNSLDGPAPRRTSSSPLGLWADDATGTAASGAGSGFTNMAAVEHAAQAVACPICQELLDHVWAAVSRGVRSHEPVNEVAARDMVDDGVDAAVTAVLKKYSIRQVEASAGLMTGAVWFVVRDRRPGEGGPSAAEQAAVQQAAQELVATNLLPLGKAVMDAAKSYFRQFNEIIRKSEVARLRETLATSARDDEYGDGGGATEAEMVAEAEAEAKAAACRDEELMCASWAAIGECEANPVYMTGAGRHRGHCELSCRVCQPDGTWRSNPRVTAELDAAAATAATLLRSSACALAKACLVGGGSVTSGPGAAVQFVEKEPEITPGAMLANMPGFVLGKPFWGRPTLSLPPPLARAATTHPDAADPVDVALHAEMGNKVLGIMGMDGFFRYDLLYRQRVYQFHEEKDGTITESWTMGEFDAEATAAARAEDAKARPTRAQLAWSQARRAAARAARDGDAGAAGDGVGKGKGDGAADAGAAGAVWEGPPPPMLDALDLLPDQPAMMLRAWPYRRQMYTHGDMCTADTVKQPRRVELRVACSPDAALHMLVREPDFCTYILVIFSPSLCRVPGYEPVRMTPAGGADSSSSGGGAAGDADAAGGARTRRRSSRGGKLSKQDIGPSPAAPVAPHVEGADGQAAGDGAQPQAADAQQQPPEQQQQQQQAAAEVV